MQKISNLAKTSLKINKKLLKKRLPITEWLPRYSFAYFLRDLLAGFTVSLTEIPQAISYAGIAGLPPEYGLYSCIMGGFTYAIFGSCKDINIGPTSILALLIGPYVLQFGPAVAVMMCFLSGIITFSLGLLNLGFVIEFFSYPVVAGFTCAASTQVATLQLNNFFGTTGVANKFLPAWKEFVENFDDIKVWDSILGVLSLLVLILLKGLRRYATLSYRSDWSRYRNIIGIVLFFSSVARNAIVIIVGMGIAYGYRDNIPFAITGDVKAGFPSFEIPKFSTNYKDVDYSFGEMASNIGITFLFISLFGILETVSAAKSLSHGKSLDATQEILTIGITNILSSFVSSMPVSGAFSRSAINKASAVKTPLGGIFTSLITLLAIWYLTPTFYYVPKTTMASVIISTMIYLFEYKAFVLLWKNEKLDLIPFLVTFICCLVVSQAYGVLIGIGVNILFVLYPSARPNIKIDKENILKLQMEVCVVKPMQNLYFPAAENLKDRVLKLADQNTFVIDGECLTSIDSTVAKSLVTLSKELLNRNNILVLWNFKPSIMNVLTGLDNSLSEYFKTGNLEDVVQGNPLKQIQQPNLISADFPTKSCAVNISNQHQH